MPINDRYITSSAVEILNDAGSLLDLLESSGLRYTIKDGNLNYILSSRGFNTLLGISKDYNTDFDIFPDHIAYKITRDDSTCFTTQLGYTTEQSLTFANGSEVYSITRNIVKIGEDSYLLSTYNELPEAKKQEYLERYNNELDESEIFEKIINRFSTLIFSHTKRKEIFVGVAQLCIDVLKLEDFAIFIYSKESEKLEQVIIANAENEIKWRDDHDDLIELTINQGITGKCARTKQTVLVEDISLDQDYIRDRNTNVCELAVPIVYKNELLGVIDTESSRFGRYDRKISEVLEGIASLLAIKLNELNNYKLLKEQNRIFSSIIKDNPTSVALLDQNFNYIEVSNKWREDFLKDKDEDILGKNHFRLNPNIPLRWKKIIMSALSGESTTIDKETYQKKNGEVEVYKGKVTPWYKSKEEIGGVLISVEIITDVIKVKLELSQTNKELEEARKLGRIFTWEYDTEKRRYKWHGNRIVPELLSGQYYDVKEFFNRIDEEYHEDLFRIQESLFEGETTFSVIHPFRLEDKTYWFHNRGEGVYDNGKLVRILGTVQDITIQVDAEKIYKRQNVELKKTNTELDKFVYKTVHDLRAPLTNLYGLLRLMRAEKDEKVLSSYFDLQEKSIRRLDTFIQKITTYTKNKRLPKYNRKLNFDLIIDDVLNNHNFIEHSERVLKMVNVDNTKEYFSDPERIAIILNNLVSNAIKFVDLSKKENHIKIFVTTEGENIKLRVRDNGLGIAEDLKVKIFEMFFRGHKESDGAGIGLYILRETVNSLDGSVSLDSCVNEYTEFTIYLPNIKLPR